MPQPLVLAIEPDLRQAAIVKRIVREKVLADVAVVDSRDAAMEAMRTTIPDVLLLSALMSPRDEDELIAHLRTLEHADHLQTHTIPQLASALSPIESRMPRGLLSAFRRKKEPEVAPSGCDPDLFAEEIRVFLERAADKKRERSAAAPGAAPTDTAWRTAHPQKAAGPVTTADAVPEAEATASSSWSSPFEWKPSTSSSPMADPESAPASSDDPLPSVESLMAHLRPPAGIPTVADLDLSGTADLSSSASGAISSDAVDLASPVAGDLISSGAEDLASSVAGDLISSGAEDLASSGSDLTSSAHVEETLLSTQPAEVFVPDSLPLAAAAPVQESRPTAEARGPKTEDRASRIKDRGLGIRGQRLGLKDKTPARLGALASWARSEERSREAVQGSDDLRGLLTGLAVPPAVVSVGYGRGCRIRRVRVLGTRGAREGEGVGAVIISRRLLAEQRDLRDQPPA